MKKVFVGGLDRFILDEVLKMYFEFYGEMIDCVVICDGGKVFRGFGYVIFVERESVLKVLGEKFYMIDGKIVEVKWVIFRNEDSVIVYYRIKKFFIGGLKDEMIMEDIK